MISCESPSHVLRTYLTRKEPRGPEVRTQRMRGFSDMSHPVRQCLCVRSCFRALCRIRGLVQLFCQTFQVPTSDERHSHILLKNSKHRQSDFGDHKYHIAIILIWAEIDWPYYNVLPKSMDVMSSGCYTMQLLDYLSKRYRLYIQNVILMSKNFLPNCLMVAICVSVARAGSPLMSWFPRFFRYRDTSSSCV